MSVGDLGLIDGQWYLCSVFGFKKITKEQAEKVEAMDFRDRLFLRNGADIETLPAVLAMGRERHSPSKFPR